MGAAVCLHVFITIGVKVGAVDDDLGPAMRVHRPERDLEGQVPHHALCVHEAVAGLERMLTHSALLAARNRPVRSRHEVILDSKTVMIDELAKLDLARHRHIEE